MPAARLTELPELTSVSSTDWLYVVDVSNTTDNPDGSSRKVLVSNVLAAFTLPDNSVTDAKLRDSQGCSVIGRATNTTGDPGDIVCGAGDLVLQRVGDTLTWAQITAGMIPIDSITYAKLQNTAAGNVVLCRASSLAGDLGEVALAASRLLGRGSTGDIAAISLGATLEMSTTTLQIPNDGVTYAKMQNVSAASRLLGRGSAAGSGDPEEISLDSSLTMSSTTLSVTSAAPTFLYKSSDQATASTTPVDVSDMTFAVAANKAYAVRAYIVWQTGATGNSIRIGVNGPTSPTLVQFRNAKDQSTTGGTDQVFTAQMTAYDTSNPAQTSEGNADTNLIWTMDGVFINGANAGTFALRVWAEVGTSNVTIKAGSYLEYKLLN